MLTTKDRKLLKEFYGSGKSLEEALDMWKVILDDYTERLGEKLDIPKLSAEIEEITPFRYKPGCQAFFVNSQLNLIVSMITGKGNTSQVDNSPKNSGLWFSEEGTVTIKGIKGPTGGEGLAGVQGTWAGYPKVVAEWASTDWDLDEWRIEED